MPRFRSTRAQAEYAISQKIALGKGRHDHQRDGRIHSVGTARGYEQALKGFAGYLQENRLGDLQSATVQEAQEYLADRAAVVAQKTLDLDRQSIQMHLGVELEVIKSEKETILSTRSYTPVQVERIGSAQTERNRLATEIAYNAGLRAHELLTLRPAGERQASTHRQWSPDRFISPVKSRPLNIALPEIKDASDLPKITGALLTAVATGQIDPGEAAVLSRVVEVHRGALEIADITDRIKKLEDEVKK